MTSHRQHDYMVQYCQQTHPYSKDHGVNMGPIWGRQDPGGPHVGPMNFAIWVPFDKEWKYINAADSKNI